MYIIISTVRMIGQVYLSYIILYTYVTYMHIYTYDTKLCTCRACRNSKKKRTRRSIEHRAQKWGKNMSALGVDCYLIVARLSEMVFMTTCLHFILEQSIYMQKYTCRQKSLLFEFHILSALYTVLHTILNIYSNITCPNFVNFENNNFVIFYYLLRVYLYSFVYSCVISLHIVDGSDSSFLCVLAQKIF